MNIQSIITTNMIGIVIIIMLLISSHLVRQRRLLSDNIFTAMLLLTAFGCADEMITFILDGVQFPADRAFLMFLNGLLYIANITVSFLWYVYVDLRLYQDKTRIKTHYWKSAVPAVVGILLIIANFFGQFVYSMDENNVYHREPFGYAYYLLTFGYLLGSIINRNLYYKKAGRNEFFPIWMFLAPIFIGATAQLVVYGISVGWCSTSIGLVSIYMSLQNELSYVDNLTKLYNRSYLNQLIAEIERKDSHAGGVMIDIDYFKTINDVYGHAEGDQALVKTAEILRRATPSKGIPIRFAGDEFIVILRNTDENDILTLKNSIREELKKFNRTTEKPYKLSFSIGHSMYYGAPDTFLTQMDERMYEEKKEKHCTR